MLASALTEDGKIGIDTRQMRSEGATVDIVIKTDGRGRAVIPGHNNQRFLLHENEDGSLLLQPARVVTEAQLEYYGDPELQALLTRASRSSSVQHSRSHRSDEH